MTLMRSERDNSDVFEIRETMLLPVEAETMYYPVREEDINSN